MTEVKQDEMQTFLQLARDAVKEKDYDAAIDHLISVFQMDKCNSEAFGIMGDVALSKHDIDSAEGYYLRRLELDPQSYEAHLDLGVLYTERCDYENAIRELKTALEFSNEHGDPYLFIASIYYNLGQYDEAYDWLYRQLFELKAEQSQSNRDLYNQAYFGVASTICQNMSISDLDSLIGQIETRHNVNITTHLVVNPEAPLMPFRKTDEHSYEIDYDLDSGDKFYEVLTSLILLDNSLGGEHFEFHHFLMSTEDGKEQFAAMTRNTMDADSTLSMADFDSYLYGRSHTQHARVQEIPSRPVAWNGKCHRPILRLHQKAGADSCPRLVIYVHKVLLYMKSVQLYEYFRAREKRVDFESGLTEHKVGYSIYNDHMVLKDSTKRKDWSAFYKSFVNQVCPPLRYYMTLVEI